MSETLLWVRFEIRANGIPSLLVRHKRSPTVHVGRLGFLTAWQPLSYLVQLQNEVGPHLSRVLHRFTQETCQRPDPTHASTAQQE